MLTNILKHLKFLIQQDTQNPPRKITGKDELYIQLTTLFESNHFKVTVNDLGDGHVTFYAIKGAPSLLFNVHLDTVPVTKGWKNDPFDLTVTADKAYGRGSCDIKGAAACLMAIAESNPNHLAVLFTSDEEGASGCCVQNFIDNNNLTQFKQIIVAEPTNSKAVLSHRGYLSARSTFYGIGGHSSMAVGLKNNAIHKSAKWLSKALEYAESKTNELNPAGICFNIGTIEGGEKNNMIAETSKIAFSARVPPGSSTETTFKELKNLDDSKESKWTASMMAPALPASIENRSMAESFCNRNAISTTESVDFWTEASLFSQAGIPAVVLGPGDIKQAHTVDEWVYLSQLEDIYKIYTGVIENEN